MAKLIDHENRSLREVTIFQGLSVSALQNIERKCAWRSFAAGEPILDYLERTDDVFFIVSGEARASIYSLDGRAISFSDLKPGTTFGEYAAIDGAPRSVAIEARAPSLIAVMSGSVFRRMLEEHPEISLTLMQQFVRKIRALTTRIYEFSALAVQNRIQAELLRLATAASKDGRCAEIDPAPTHADIASRTSTHREAVARECSRLARIGLLGRSGHTLAIADIQRLSTMVHEATGE
jgi:CRP-like cAMP-binding protein